MEKTKVQEKQKLITFRLSQELYDVLEGYAKQDNRTVPNFVCHIIMNFTKDNIQMKFDEELH